jgi:hypothetical protein
MAWIWIHDRNHLGVMVLSGIHHSSKLLILHPWRLTIHVALCLRVLVLHLLLLVNEMLLWNLYLYLLHLVVLTSSTLILGSVYLWSHSFIPSLLSVVILSLNIALIKCLILIITSTDHLLIRKRWLIILFIIYHLPPCLFIQVIKFALNVISRNPVFIRCPLFWRWVCSLLHLLSLLSLRLLLDFRKRLVLELNHRFWLFMTKDLMLLWLNYFFLRRFIPVNRWHMSWLEIWVLRSF